MHRRRKFGFSLHKKKNETFEDYFELSFFFWTFSRDWKRRGRTEETSSQVSNPATPGRAGPDVGTLPDPNGDPEGASHLDPEADYVLKKRNEKPKDKIAQQQQQQTRQCNNTSFKTQNMLSKTIWDFFQFNANIILRKTSKK